MRKTKRHGRFLYEYTWKVVMEPPYSKNSGYTRKTTPILEVGDYSLLIKKNLKNVTGLYIRSRNSEWIETKEVVSTSAGTMLYFKDSIKGIFKKGCIYPIVMHKYAYKLKDLEYFTQKLFKGKSLTLNKYLKFLK